MKKKGLNLLSIFLASLFIISAMVGMIPAAYASETETEDYESNETNYESEESASGSNEGGIFVDADLELEEITIENPDNNGESAEINANDQFSHYLPTEGIGGYVVADEVYALENVGNSGLWMDIESGKSTPGYHMQQQALTSNPVQTFTRRYLFKISRVPGTNRYVIRSMLNNMLTFYCSGNEVLTKEIPPNDADVAISDSYQIEYLIYEGCFIIRPYATSSAIATGSSTDSGEFLIKSTSSASGDRGKWYMYKYTGAVKDGLTVTKNKSTIKGMPTGMTVTFTARIWCTVIGVNTPYIVVAPGYEDIVSSTWNNTNRSITVTSMKAGKLRFKIKLMYDNMQKEYRAYNYDYITVPDIDGKTMFIKNAATGKYMDIEGPSKAEGAIIQQWQFNDKPQSKWTFTAYDGGYFTIKSKYSNMYVGVDSTDTTVIRQYSATSDYTMWKFEETSSGNYKLICKATESSETVLATAAATSGNGSNLKMTTYTDDTNYRDEWCPQQYVVFENMVVNRDENLTVSPYSLKDTVDDSPTSFTYTLISGSNIASVNSSTGVISGINTGTALIRATNAEGEHTYFRVYVPNRAIIIVPGIMGSVLVKKDDDDNELIVWDASLINDIKSGNIVTVVSKILSLKCYNDGSTRSNIVASQRHNYGAGDEYKLLIDALKTTYESKYSISFFSYDWRLSNQISGESLNTYIQNNKFDSVVLVCHSMGGLVASSYLTIGQDQRDKVETMISLGTPYLGTPTMPALWGTEDVTLLIGDIQGFTNWMPSWALSLLAQTIDSENRLDGIIGNFASLYEMFPTEKYFDSSYANKRYLKTAWAGIIPIEAQSYDSAHAEFEEHLAYYNTELANNAKNFHNSLFVNGEHITSLINAYYLAGYWSDNLDVNGSQNTVDGILWNIAGWYVESRTAHGDRTVPVWSADLANSYPNQTFYAEGVTHDYLVKTSDVLDFVKGLINHNTSIPTNSVIRSVYEYQ